MRHLGLFFSLIFIFTASMATSETVKNLIIERAEAEYGAEMPVNGRFDVRMPEGSTTEAEYVSDFWMDRDNGRFIAIVISKDGISSRISGVAPLKVPVPVASRQMMPDEIITKNDLRIVELSYPRINAFTVTDIRDLVGKQVRRVLVRGRPIQRQSVIPPIVVSRGARVTIRFSHGPLVLSAQGRALSDAYLGQELRVVNLQSNKTITVVAQSDGSVEVPN